MRTSTYVVTEDGPRRSPYGSKKGYKFYLKVLVLALITMFVVALDSFLVYMIVTKMSGSYDAQEKMPEQLKILKHMPYERIFEQPNEREQPLLHEQNLEQIPDRLPADDHNPQIEESKEKMQKTTAVDCGPDCKSEKANIQVEPELIVDSAEQEILTEAKIESTDSSTTTIQATTAAQVKPKSTSATLINSIPKIQVKKPEVVKPSVITPKKQEALKEKLYKLPMD